MKAFIGDRNALPMKMMTAIGMYSRQTSKTSASCVNSPNNTFGKHVTTMISGNAQQALIVAAVHTTFETRSYFSAPMFCPTIELPAVFTEFAIKLLTLFNLAPIPDTAETTTPYVLTHELTNSFENWMDALLKAIGKPNLTSGPSRSRSIRKYEIFRSTPRLSWFRIM